MTVFRRKWDSIINSNLHAIVDPVNCVGVLGAGLARVFRQYYPLEHKIYVDLCKEGKLALGSVAVSSVIVQRPNRPRFIVWFPTKWHFRESSDLNSIEEGLDSLANSLKDLQINSIAVPLLGCGLGGLKPDDVIPLIKEKLEGAVNLVDIYETFRGNSR